MINLVTGRDAEARRLLLQPLAVAHDALRQAQRRVMPALRPIPTAEIGRGAAQNENGTMAFRQIVGRVARMIVRFRNPGRLFVAGVMLFIQHDQPEVLQRREERRSRADNDRYRATARPLPGVITLAHGQAAVHKRHLPRETL